MLSNNSTISVSFLITFLSLTIFGQSINAQSNNTSAVVPLILDHNRMLIDGEIQRKDGSWRQVRFWIDSGSPDFIMSESLASDLGIELTNYETSSGKASIEIPPPANIRIVNMDLNFENVKSKVVFKPFWLFNSMHNDANIPATALKKYHVIIDYPGKQFTIGAPGSFAPRGTQLPVTININTGIVQIDALIDNEQFSFAMDLGASYSFISEDKLKSILIKHPEWPHVTGTSGCANMWGWWPANEENFQLIRVPQIKCEQLVFDNVGIAGVPAFSAEGPTLGEWYSQKTSRPVDGFLGTNAFKPYRIEIDYLNSKIYLEKAGAADTNEMDLVGISLRLLHDQTYQVVGVVKKNGLPLVPGVEAGDILIRIDDLETKGLTLGTVTDALRGKPGDIHILTLNRNGKEVIVRAKTAHYL